MPRRQFKWKFFHEDYCHRTNCTSYSAECRSRSQMARQTPTRTFCWTGMSGIKDTEKLLFCSALSSQKNVWSSCFFLLSSLSTGKNLLTHDDICRICQNCEQLSSKQWQHLNRRLVPCSCSFGFAVLLYTLSVRHSMKQRFLQLTPEEFGSLPQAGVKGMSHPFLLFGIFSASKVRDRDSSKVCLKSNSLAWWNKFVIMTE